MKCLEYAMSYLSKYPKTEQEIRILMYRKWYNTDEIMHAMDVLKRNDFINDEKFAETYLYSEVVKKGKPVFVIKQKLLQKGVDKKLIDKLIFEMKDEMWTGIKSNIQKEIQAYKKKGIDWFDAIQKLIRKWYRIDDIKWAIKSS